MMKFVLPPLFSTVFGSKFLIKSKCSIVLLPVQRTFMTIVTRTHLPKLSQQSALSSCISMSTSSSNISEEREEFEKWLLHAKYQGFDIPENISEEGYDYLINSGHYQRLKYLRYLHVRHWKRMKGGERKEKLKENRIEDKERRDNLQPEHLYYGLWNESMFIKVNRNNCLDLYYEKLASARMHELPVIFDLSFDEHMRGRELASLAREVLMAIAHNRESRNPLHISMSNVNFDSRSFKILQQLMPSLENIPMKITSETYLDAYPKEKLVYLTPDAKQEITFFDPESIYIIGGIVDLGSAQPLTFTKAREEGIRTQKLPLNRYHVFRSKKSLGIHVVAAILRDLRNTGSWRQALVNVPARLIKTGTEEHSRNWASLKPKVQ